MDLYEPDIVMFMTMDTLRQNVPIIVNHFPFLPLHVCDLNLMSAANFRFECVYLNSQKLQLSCRFMVWLDAKN